MASVEKSLLRLLGRHLGKDAAEVTSTIPLVEGMGLTDNQIKALVEDLSAEFNVPKLKPPDQGFVTLGDIANALTYARHASGRRRFWFWRE